MKYLVLILYSSRITPREILSTWNFISMFVQLFDITEDLQFVAILYFLEKSICAFNILFTWKKMNFSWKKNLIFIGNIYWTGEILQESHFIFKERAGSSGPLASTVRCSLQRTERESFIIPCSHKITYFVLRCTSIPILHL